MKKIYKQPIVLKIYLCDDVVLNSNYDNFGDDSEFI